MVTPKLASISDEAKSYITVLPGGHSVLSLSPGKWGCGQWPAICSNSTDHANMSTVIQCCFHTSLFAFDA